MRKGKESLRGGGPSAPRAAPGIPETLPDLSRRVKGLVRSGLVSNAPCPLLSSLPPCLKRSSRSSRRKNSEPARPGGLTVPSPRPQGTKAT